MDEEDIIKLSEKEIEKIEKTGAQTKELIRIVKDSGVFARHLCNLFKLFSYRLNW